MMDKDLFWPIDQENDPHWIIKDFFNDIYSVGRFIWTLAVILKKHGCGSDYSHCIFPDFIDSDPAGHFEGVIFIVGDWEILVTESVAFDYLKQACDKYVQLHPKEKEEIDILWELFPIK